MGTYLCRPGEAIGRTSQELRCRVGGASWTTDVLDIANARREVWPATVRYFANGPSSAGSRLKHVLYRPPFLLLQVSSSQYIVLTVIRALACVVTAECNQHHYVQSHV